MPKSKSTRTDRTKRASRDPNPEREKQSERKRHWEPLDDLYGDSNGAVDSEMEFDTGKYESPAPAAPPRKG